VVPLLAHVFDNNPFEAGALGVRVVTPNPHSCSVLRGGCVHR
jgi:hypothetical protein